jgi:hypothetical protein
MNSYNVIKVIDNFLTNYEVNEYQKLFDSMAFGQGFDNDSNISGRFKSFGNKKDIDVTEISRHEKYILDKLKRYDLLYVDEKLKVVYYNALRIGDKFKFHQDWDGHTFLIYTNKKWYRHWEGQTIFKTGSYPIYKSVYPSPGRLVIFNGKIEHKASPPSIFNNMFARYSLVFQFSKL